MTVSRNYGNNHTTRTTNQNNRTMEVKNYEALPEVVKVRGIGIHGMTAKLIKRTEGKAMYLRWDNVYEVFRRKVQDANEIYDRKYPRRELYPNSEDFGSIAWSFKDKDEAEKRYTNIPDKVHLIGFKKEELQEDDDE